MPQLNGLLTLPSRVSNRIADEATADHMSSQISLSIVFLIEQMSGQASLSSSRVSKNCNIEDEDFQQLISFITNFSRCSWLKIFKYQTIINRNQRVK
jgi:hypothetical protein